VLLHARGLLHRRNDPATFWIMVARVDSSIGKMPRRCYVLAGCLRLTNLYLMLISQNKMKINIDSSAGFCWGVVQTIQKVEETLANNQIEQNSTTTPHRNIYVLGEIIHNPNEIKRLKEKNLQTIDYDQLSELKNAKLIIRAHGEPPSTYKQIPTNVEIVDATCPLVRRLQKRIRQYYNDGWQIVIFGKYNHSEVVGLRGVCNDECVVGQSYEEIISQIDTNRQTVLFSQTTMNAHILVDIYEHLSKHFIDYTIKLENTVCKFMINREKKLAKFAKDNDLILFVAGHHSSNGKVLFDICRSANQNTIFIEEIVDIKNIKFGDVENIGITGATSTPMWFLEMVKIEMNKILNLE
jgi:4-hydroxy-3-methylbut-2-enyl diphosphate reductase